MTARTTPSARIGGLDGLRAIAVTLVLVYHFFPTALPGGFLGVDLFFVISGFLITSLLVREFRTTGRMNLPAFWRRRIRRLFPPLIVVMLVSTTLAVLVDRDLLVGILRQILGAFFFVSNWVFIAAGSDYFTRDAPELFRNTWSLAIEEQFYLLLPLIALFLMMLRGRLTRAIPLIALGLVSAGLMTLFGTVPGEETRVYFGSDTHSFGLLWGAALAMLLDRGGAPAPLRTAGQLGTTVLALAGLTVLGRLAVALPESSPESFAWGFQLATIASLTVVWAVTRPRAWLGRALDTPLLRWIGERSYGIYLWHWPLLLIVQAAARGIGLSGTTALWVTALVTAPTTVILASLSYTYIEQPVRRIGIRASVRTFLSGVRAVPAELRALRRSRSSSSDDPSGTSFPSPEAPDLPTAHQGAVALGIAALLVVTVPATAVAVAVAPERTSSAEMILRGQEQLEQANTAPDTGDTAEPDTTTDADADADGAADSPSDGVDNGPPDAEGTAPLPDPPVITGDDITAIGDSVMLASFPELSARYPGITVDAEVSRGLGVGRAIIAEQAAAGALRPIIVIGLGTNGPIDTADLEGIVDSVGPDHAVVLVNAHGERDWIPGVNDELQRFAATHRGVTVAPWTERVSTVAGALAGDDIHPNPSGGEIYADVIGEAIAALEDPGEVRGWGVPRR